MCGARVGRGWGEGGEKVGQGWGDCWEEDEERVRRVWGKGGESVGRGLQKTLPKAEVPRVKRGCRQSLLLCTVLKFNALHCIVPNYSTLCINSYI